MSDVDAPRLRLMHRAREREVEIAFARIPAAAFPNGLELGAGDCYQSRCLKKYVGHLTCTDFDESLLNRSDPDLSYLGCDAEHVASTFSGQCFDLVFSSNMLPHTPSPRSVLQGLHSVTHDDSLLVFVVPNPLWKLFKLALFYPRLVIALPRRLRAYAQSESPAASGGSNPMKLTNNPKVATSISAWRRRLLPVPVGVYRGNWHEVFGSRRSRWIHELEATGWRAIRVARGPFIVGDMNAWWNRLLAALGLSTENIFVAAKSNVRSRYESFFVDSFQPHT